MTDHHGDTPSRPPRPGARRTGTAAAAGQRVRQQIAAARQTRRQRVLLGLAGLMSLFTLVASGGAWVLTSYVSGSLGRVSAGTSGTPSSGPVNILIAGIDTRGGLTRRQELRLHVGDAISSNSDTLMLVHIPASHDSIQVVSLPRDSWVSIPGHGMNKINAAYGIGGPPLMVRTVEQATGLQVNDYVEVNFLGFVKVVNAVGGVNVCLPFAVDDHYSGLRLSAGEHHVGGVTALSFVRDRHSFALSDLQRIKDQQQLLSSLFTEATAAGVLANPVRLHDVISSVASAVRVDSGFDLARLADELRGIRPSDISFTTVPLASVNYQTPDGESAVLWNKARAAALFSWLKKDTGTRPPGSSSGRSGRAARKLRASRAKVVAEVYNGTDISRLSASTGKQLAALGFDVRRSGLNWPSATVATTLIRYPAGQTAGARLLAGVLPGARLQEVASLSQIQVVLGAAGHTVAGKPLPASSAAPVQQHTAAQDACRGK